MLLVLWKTYFIKFLILKFFPLLYIPPLKFVSH